VIAKSSLSLAVIAGTCASLLALTQWLTNERIDNNTRAHELRLITQLAGTTPPASSGWSADVWDLCNNTVLTRVKVAGYGGEIALIIALRIGAPDPRVRGLRIVSHQETPGLADFLEQPDRGWIGELAGRNRPQADQFDGVAGATITSRAVQRGVSQAFSLVANPTPQVARCGT
jgi:electron transport complex protein RnfG